MSHGLESTCLLWSPDLWVHKAVARGARGQADADHVGAWSLCRHCGCVLRRGPFPAHGLSCPCTLRGISLYPRLRPSSETPPPCRSGVTGTDWKACGPFHTSLFSEGSEFVPRASHAALRVNLPFLRTAGGWGPRRCRGGAGTRRGAVTWNLASWHWFSPLSSVPDPICPALAPNLLVSGKLQLPSRRRGFHWCRKPRSA